MYKNLLSIGLFLAGTTAFGQVYLVTDGTGVNITSTAGATFKSDNLIYSGAGTLTFANDATIDGALTAQGTKIEIGSGTLNVTGNITSSGQIEIGSGTLDCDGNFDATGGSLAFTGTGNLKLAGSVTSFGTITQGSGKITYDGGNQTVLTLNGNGTTGSYEDLEIAGTGTKTLSGTSDIYGDLILSSASFDLNGKTIYPKNDILTTSGEIIASSASNITYDNSGTHALSGVNSENITIKTTSTGGSVTSTGNITCGSIDLTSGTKTVYLDGETINVATDIIVTAGTLNITDGIVNINSNTTNSCLVEGGTLDLDGGILNVGNSYFADLSVSSGTIDVSGGTLNISDEFDIEDGTVTQSGGVINIKSYVGSAQGNSANKFDMSAGTLNLLGGTLNLLGQKATEPYYTAMNVASGVTVNASTGHTTVISSNNSSSNDEDIYLELNGKSLGNLTINLGGHEVFMNTDMNVLGNLTLTEGIFETSGNTLYLGSSSSNATISGGSASSYIVAYDNSGTIGKVVHYVNSNDTYNFPIGDANNYTPITLTLSSGTLSSANLTAYTMGRKVDGMSDDIQTNINRSWSIEPSGITSPSYDVSYTYATGEWVGDQFFDLVPVKLSAGQWYRPTNSVLTGATPQGSGAHNTSTNTLTWTGLSSFSIFGGAGGGSALPVEMVSLNAECIAEGHYIEWVTASENNSDYFSLEYSRDGLNWLSVKEIDAAGFSNELITYAYMNPVTSDGDHYYRIIQNDIDGQSELFGPIHLNCGQSSNQKINIYPNPNSNEFYISIFEIENQGKAIIEILDLKGNVCFTEKIQIADGVNVYVMNTDLSSGLYILRIIKDSIIFDSKNLIIR